MDIRIVYMGHSGFMVETDREYLLFDYNQGKIPEMDAHKPLYVFVSHRHADHFNPAIFKLAESHPPVKYILSYDIKLKPWNMEKWKLTETVKQCLYPVAAGAEYAIGEIRIQTLKSTDEGVAFLVETGGVRIYHAGDLNWWYWEEESKQWNNNMTASFKREADKLTGMSIDLAFLPLDPRQGADYWRGMEYMLHTANIRYVFPMHFWKDSSVIQRFQEEGYAKGCGAEIMEIAEEGQHWKLAVYNPCKNSYTLNNENPHEEGTI